MRVPALSISVLLTALLGSAVSLSAVTYPTSPAETYTHNGETIGYWVPDTYDAGTPTRVMVFMRGAGTGLLRPDEFISALEIRGVTAIVVSNNDSYGTILPDVLVSELSGKGWNGKDKIFLTGFSRGGQMSQRIALQLPRSGLMGAAPQNNGSYTTPSGKLFSTLEQYNGGWLPYEPWTVSSSATPWTGSATEVGYADSAVPESQAIPYMTVINLGESTRLPNNLFFSHEMRVGPWNHTHFDSYWGPRNIGHNVLSANQLAVVDFYLTLENNPSGDTAPAAEISGAHTRIINPGVFTTLTGTATDTEDDDSLLTLGWYQITKADESSLKNDDFLSYCARYLDGVAGWFPIHENSSISTSLGIGSLYGGDNRPAVISSSETFSFTAPTVSRDTPVFLEFKATDSHGFSDTASVLVIINGPPRILEGPNYARTIVVNSPTPMTFRALDADSDGLSWSITGAPSNGSLSWQDAAGEYATLTYTPYMGYTGPDSFSIQVTDINGLSETLTAELTVSDAAMTIPAEMDALLNNGGDLQPFVCDGASLELKANDFPIGNWNNLDEAYFRFPLDGFDGDLVSAKLRVHVTQRNQTSSPDTFTLYEITQDNFDEMDASWPEPPTQAGGQLGSISVTATGTYEIDVTAAVQASLDATDMKFSLQLNRTGSDQGPHFASRHYADPALRPQLIIETLVGEPQAPIILTQPQSQTVDEGDSVMFSVQAEGVPLPDFQWKKDGSNLTDGGAISGATTDQLTLSATAQADAGNYTVVVTNTQGSVTSSVASLTVNAVAPTIQTHPVGGSFVEGDSLVLSVVATGSPTLTYQWKKNGADLVDGGSISGAQTDSLSISPLALANSGSYTVTVTNSQGSDTSTAVTVTVYEAPDTLIQIDFNDVDTAPAGNWNTIPAPGSTANLIDFSTGLQTPVGIALAGSIQDSSSTDTWGFRTESPAWADSLSLSDRFYISENQTGTMTLTGLTPGAAYDIELTASYAGAGTSGDDPGLYVLTDADGPVEGFNAFTGSSLGTDVYWTARFKNEDGTVTYGVEGWMAWYGAVARPDGTLLFDLSTPPASNPRIALNAMRIATVAEAPTGIEAWRMTWFGTTENTGNAADTAIPQKDGIPNLLKYAFGLNPTENSAGMLAGPGQPGLPWGELVGNDLVLTYRKDTALTDITLSVERSGDLENWNSTGLIDTLISTDGSVELREASVEVNPANPKQFLQVDVTRP